MRQAGLPTYKYAAFLSYKRTLDQDIATSLQTGLHRIAKPWNQLRGIRVFRDKSDLTLSDKLWSSLQQGLERSEFLILLASSESARAPWVQREVEYWLQHRSIETLLIVLTDGEIVWNDSQSDFDWERTSALPPQLQKKYVELPLYIDLRWARTSESLSLNDPQFKEAVAELAARLRGKERAEILSEDLRQHRKNLRLAWTAVVMLSLLTIIAGAAAWIAIRQKRVAEDNDRISRYLLYIANMNLAQKAHEEGNYQLSRQLLEVYQPRSGEDDFRDFYWRYLWSLNHNESATFKGHTSQINSVAFSPDGKKLVSGGDDGTIKIWEVGRQQEVRSVKGEFTFAEAVTFTPDGKQVGGLCSHGMTKLVKLWDAESGREIASYTGPEEAVPSVIELSGSRGAALHLGRMLLASSDIELKSSRVPGATEPLVPPEYADLPLQRGGNANETEREFIVRLWDIGREREIARLRGHSAIVREIAFSLDGKRIATAGKDRTVKVWNVDTGRELLTLKGHADEIFALAFSPRNNWLASGSSDGVVKIWDLATGREVRTLKEFLYGITSLNFSGDGQILAVGNRQGIAKLLDAAEGRVLATLKGNDGEVASMAFSANGEWVAAGGGRGEFRNTVKIWALKNPWIHSNELVLAGHQGAVNSVGFGGDGKIAASAGDDKTVRIWDAQTGRELRTLPHTDRVKSVTFVQEGRLLAGLAFDGNLRFWSVEDWQERSTLKLGEEAGTLSAWSGNGAVLATGSQSDILKLYDASSGRALRVLSGEGNRPTSLAITHAGSLLAAAHDTGIVDFWDVTHGRQIKSLVVHPWVLVSLAIERDGKRLAGGTREGNIQFIDLERQERLGMVVGHADMISAISFSPDGKTMVTGSWDKTIKLWSMRNGKELASLGNHRDVIHAVAFSGDGKLLASGSADGTIRLYLGATDLEVAR